MGVQAGEVVITWLPLDFLKVIRFFFPSSWSLIRFCRARKKTGTTGCQWHGSTVMRVKSWTENGRNEKRLTGTGSLECPSKRSVLFKPSEPRPASPPLFSSQKQQIRSTLPVFSQGPEEFRVNKWITYLKSHLENVYTCRLARLIWLISPMRSL